MDEQAGTMKTATCISPYIDVQVDEKCIIKEKEQGTDYGAYFLYATLMAALLFAVLLAWQVSNIIGGGKGKGRRKASR
jgi:hypothetical protein